MRTRRDQGVLNLQKLQVTDTALSMAATWTLWQTGFLVTFCFIMTMQSRLKEELLHALRL